MCDQVMLCSLELNRCTLLEIYCGSCEFLAIPTPAEFATQERQAEERQTGGGGGFGDGFGGVSGEGNPVVRAFQEQAGHVVSAGDEGFVEAEADGMISRGPEVAEIQAGGCQCVLTLHRDIANPFAGGDDVEDGSCFAEVVEGFVFGGDVGSHRVGAVISAVVVMLEAVVSGIAAGDTGGANSGINPRRRGTGVIGSGKADAKQGVIIAGGSETVSGEVEE